MEWLQNIPVPGLQHWVKAMPDYRAYIMGQTATSKIVSNCDAMMMSKLSGSPSKSLMVTTLSYGNWIDTSRHSSTRPSGRN